MYFLKKESFLLLIAFCSLINNLQISHAQKNSTNTLYSTTTIVQVSPSLTDIPAGPGILNFSITFSDPMNTTVDPLVSFGLFDPFEMLQVQPTTPTAWITSTTWTGISTIDVNTTQGLATIKVKTAFDIFNNPVPENIEYHFLITTSGASANNGVAIAIGVGKNEVVWTDRNLPLTYSHYNIRRNTFAFDGDPQLILQPEDQINPQGIMAQTYIDENVTYNTYYVYAVYLVHDDMTEEQWTPPFIGINPFAPPPIEEPPSSTQYWTVYP